MPSESKATVLKDALAELFPSIETEVLPVSTPVAAIGLRVHFAGEDWETYVPALDSWWLASDDLAQASETSVAIDASIEAVISMIAFDLGNYLVMGGLIVGRETSAEATLFGELVRFLADVIERGEPSDAVILAPIYLALLNTAQEDTQYAQGFVKDDPASS